MVGEGGLTSLGANDMATRSGSTVVVRRGDVPATFDVTAAPRAVLRESMRLLGRMLGEQRLGSAQANVRAAIRDDEERARARAEVARMLEDARRDA
jgi:hypothetical protein